MGVYGCHFKFRDIKSGLACPTHAAAAALTTGYV